MKYITFFIYLLCLNMICNGQSNNIILFDSKNSLSNICDYTNIMSVAWNFVADSKNLTIEEKEYYNNLATSIRNTSYFGIQSIEIIATQVKLLDSSRELQKKIKLGNTNINWIGSVVVQNWQEIEKDSYQSEPGVLKGMWSNPSYKIGFREDGVVVWKFISTNENGVDKNK